MSDFVNTVDVIGDDAVCDQLITKTITEIKENRVTKVGDSCFYGCSQLTAVDLPAVTNILEFAFYKCNALTTVDLLSITRIEQKAFSSCSSLATVIIRNAENICDLASNTAFEGTLVKSGTGYIYVPAALVDSYKAATNWSTYANQIRAIEDYPDICGG